MRTNPKPPDDSPDATKEVDASLAATGEFPHQENLVNHGSGELKSQDKKQASPPNPGPRQEGQASQHNPGKS